MRRVLVTGASGFVGTHLVAALRRSGSVAVTGVSRHAVQDGADRWEVADVTAPGVLDAVVARVRPDEVYHLVGQTRGTDADVERSNVESARAMLAAVRAHAPHATVVLVGSAAEYGAVPAEHQPVGESWSGAPVFAYGRAKAAVSALARDAAASGMRVMVARPFNVVGAGVPATLVVGAMIERLAVALAGPPPRVAAVGDTTAVRDWVDVDDVADALVTIARLGAPGEAYNVCTGVGRPVSDVVDALRTLAGGGVAVESRSGISRPGEVRSMVGSSAKLRALGWRATRDLGGSIRAAWEGAPVTGGAVVR
jgi:GDP-4-dehydro-6-deoxy-D-mannose reductase